MSGYNRPIDLSLARDLEKQLPREAQASASTHVQRDGLSDPERGRAFAAPGRVNLIGEHTDYTGGYVMPMAIPLTTFAVVSSSPDSHIHVFSELFPHDERIIHPADCSGKIGAWSDYPVGVLRELQQLGIIVPPFTLNFRSTVPLGSGLSSSASVEVATAVALLAHAGARLPLHEIALLSQRAENLYVGSPCGIMDQFASTAAVRGHALLLQTRTLQFELLPVNTGQLADCRIVVVNSGVKHSITAGGDYEVRRRAAEEGQQIVRNNFDVADLGVTTLDQLSACRTQISAEAFKRCRHIVTENTRTLQAASAMRAGDPAGVGQAMICSHISQRDDFECSVPEIDFLVETALNLDGCYGSRLTGGGFGGCTVSLVHAKRVERFVSAILQLYQIRYGHTPEAYVFDASDGALAFHPEVVA